MGRPRQKATKVPITQTRAIKLLAFDKPTIEAAMAAPLSIFKSEVKDSRKQSRSLEMGHQIPFIHSLHLQSLSLLTHPCDGPDVKVVNSYDVANGPWPTSSPQFPKSIRPGQEIAFFLSPTCPNRSIVRTLILYILVSTSSLSPHPHRPHRPRRHRPGTCKSDCQESVELSNTVGRRYLGPHRTGTRSFRL